MSTGTFLSGVKGGRGVKLTTSFNLVSKLGMRRAIPLLVTYSLRAQAQIYLMLIVGRCSRDHFLLILRVFIINPYVAYV